MLKRLGALCAATLLGGCMLPTTLVQRPPEGLEALRFRETVRFSGPLGNTLEFPAGTIFVQDRVRDRDAVKLWCGPMTIRDIAVETRQTCMTLEGQRVGLIADVLENGWPRDLPPGSTEITRLP